MSDDKSVLESLRDETGFINELKTEFKRFSEEREKAELELTRKRMESAIKHFMLSRRLTPSKMKKHRIQRKLKTVIKSVLIERDKELRPWAYTELPKASNKHIGNFGALYGLERGPKETAKAFRQRLLERLRMRGPSGN